ncbi:SPOR domain-containing protein [Microbulbifer pacificus]|uniref:SPOR domain-containing protein n=1 Tax=Microbulbifer pacificus TaxID=407164 RepID=UPI000CF49FD4|nr:SPOR domain-containing protein [Microbulbifer pacificus]
MNRRNASRRKSRSQSKPMWAWFVLGNFVGGFLVFAIFLHSLKQDDKPAADKEPEVVQQAEEKSTSPRFDFYTLLQENEVSVPLPKTPKLARRVPSKKELAAIEENSVYILQAASFKKASEAERLRAQLILANLNVKVETVSDSRGTWHRVLAGPYSNRSQVAKAREVLVNHKLMPMVLKRPR